MQHLDLFSGIGGFSLALDNVYGKENIQHTFCEIDEFCCAVLEKHWPSSYIYRDIRTLTADAERSRHVHGQPEEQSAKHNQQTQRESVASVPAPFILTGGFPCQPFSQAGRRNGTEDDRYLWPEMLRVIREFAPLWVIGENVGGFITWSDGLVLRQVFSDLESEGYEVQAFIIPAVSVNAPHRRDRVWIVAHKFCERLEGKGDESKLQESATHFRHPFDSKRAKEGKGCEICGRIWNAQNAISKRRRGGLESGRQILERQSTKAEDARPDWSEHWLEVATRICRVDDGIPRRMDRNPRLKALGNAIVPQVAEEIMRAIAKTLTLPNHNTAQTAPNVSP